MDLLGNVTWHALSGPQARYTAGGTEARRYAKGFPQIVGFADPARADFTELTPYCDPGERFSCIGWSGSAPDGWHVEYESPLLKMVWDGVSKRERDLPRPMRLRPQHAPQALELVELARPGPFGPRSIELGEYFGLFDDGRLVAMAGERLFAGRLREISAVCTHPDFRGRGFALHLVRTLVERQERRDETPFMHVRGENTLARRLYEREGFRVQLESLVRVVARR